MECGNKSRKIGRTMGKAAIATILGYVSLGAAAITWLLH
jgi:hypothetical protein